MTSLRTSKDTFIPDDYIQISSQSVNDALPDQRRGRLLSLSTIRRLATSPNRLLSEFGIKYLCDRQFTTYEYEHLARQCDYSLAVRLARTAQINLALFLPPICRHLRRVITDEPDQEPRMSLLESLARLPDNTWQHMPAARHFIKQALLIAEVLNSINLGAHHLDLEYIEKNPYFTATNFDWLLLQALLACSTCESFVCDLMIRKGIFLILHDLREKYESDVRAQQCIGMILSNLSAHRSSHRHFFVARWLRVLVEWMKSEHLEMELHAAKILHNLDRPDEPFNVSIYLLSPAHRTIPYDCDIVFVHGLLGSVFKTWRQDEPTRANQVPNEEQIENSQPDSSKSALWSRWMRSIGNANEELKIKLNSIGCYTRCWPRDWLAPDLGSVRVLALNYQTHLSDWLTEHPIQHKTIEQRASELLQELQEAGVGQRPVVWVSHSMGGLLVKQILKQSTESDRESCLIRQTKGIVFYSVPHLGADLTHWPLKLSRLVLPSEEVRTLQKNSPQLIRLHQDFHSIASKNKIEILSVSESLKSRIAARGLVFEAKLVANDANLFDRERSFVLQQDHFHICKPSSRNSLSYVLTAQFIRRVLRQHRSIDSHFNLFYYSPVDLWPPIG